MVGVCWGMFGYVWGMLEYIVLCWGMFGYVGVCWSMLWVFWAQLFQGESPKQDLEEGPHSKSCDLDAK